MKTNLTRLTVLKPGRYNFKLKSDDSDKFEIISCFVGEEKTVDKVHDEILAIYKNLNTIISIDRIRK